MHGRVIGIDLGKSRAAKIAGGRRGAIGSNDIRSFLDSTGRDFLAMEREHGEEVRDMEKYARAAADSSVYQIAVVGRAPRLSWTERLSSVRGIRKKEGWNALEDPWCVICYGHGKIQCKNKGCRNGGVAHRERYVDQYLPGTNKPVYKWKRVIEKCGNCSGKGHVTCPHCQGGKREPTL